MQQAVANSMPRWMHARDGRGRGMREGLAIRQGFSIARTDIHYDEASRFQIESPDSYLRLHFKLSGECQIGMRDDDAVSITAGQIFVAVQPSDSEKYEQVALDTHERSVTLVCDHDFAASILSLSDELSPCIDHFLRRRVSRLEVEPYAMPYAIRMIVEDILNPSVASGFAPLLIEARALELLSRTIHQVVSCAHDAQPVRLRDQRRVQDLCEYLREEEAGITSSAELSRMLAWNESQMMESFKAVTGLTISSYRHQIRMDRAKRQLEGGDEPVTQIAFDAGYEHPGNFATAFKRTFGISPREMRRGIRAA